MSLETFSAEFFAQPAADVARGLLGAELLVEGMGGIVVETEAYTREGPASHSFAGKILRNASMFGPIGRAYVYRSYGIHWCLNAVCGTEGGGSAVLIRALEPTMGLQIMGERWGLNDASKLCSGPGRLCQALGVTAELDSRALDAPPFELRFGRTIAAVAVGPRIGVSRGADLPWRFGAAGSRFLSRPFPGS